MVDRYFFPGGAPFHPQTGRTGARLTGFVPADRISDAPSAMGDWVTVDGAELLSPDRETTGLELAGFNEAQDQGVEVLAGGCVVATAAVPRGAFRAEAAFETPLPARTIVTISPLPHRRSAPGAAPQLAFLLRSFRFIWAGSVTWQGFAAGDRIPFRQDALTDILPLLGEGWAGPEPDLLWSLGPSSDLWLRVEPGVGRLRFALSGNPHVADGHQPIDIKVNGERAAHAVSEHGGRLHLDLDCTRLPWLPDMTNRVTFAPERVARPPEATGDRRLLGVCLWHMDVLAKD